MIIISSFLLKTLNPQHKIQKNRFMIETTLWGLGDPAASWEKIEGTEAPEAWDPQRFWYFWRQKYRKKKFFFTEKNRYSTPMNTTPNKKREATIELYRLVIDKCYRMNLIKEMINPEELYSESIEEMDNQLSIALLPRINRILDRSLYDMYQVLYDIDVDERFIKEKIMDLENTTMIPSIIAFAIIDRLKARYAQYPLLKNPHS